MSSVLAKLLFLLHAQFSKVSLQNADNLKEPCGLQFQPNLYEPCLRQSDEGQPLEEEPSRSVCLRLKLRHGFMKNKKNLRIPFLETCAFLEDPERLKCAKRDGLTFFKQLIALKCLNTLRNNVSIRIAKNAIPNLEDRRCCSLTLDHRN
ncbi:hypothetical protein HUJ04_003448 [Dendroctonus ponderosae]|nr:hypothetical protein HUJ04_003448 [Dendroctonus ponderosae]